MKHRAAELAADRPKQEQAHPLVDLLTDLAALHRAGLVAAQAMGLAAVVLALLIPVVALVMGAKALRQAVVSAWRRMR